MRACFFVSAHLETISLQHQESSSNRGSNNYLRAKSNFIRREIYKQESCVYERRATASGTGHFSLFHC